MPDDQKLHRICNFCKDESDRLQSFIDDHHICFTVDTLSIEWLKCFGSSLQNAKSEYYEDASKDVRDLTEYNIFKG
jgi:nucleosome binding factor SPN SPT16 subunit